MNNERKKLVILHGWGHDKSRWDAFVNRFPPDEVLAFDLPGFGEETLVSDNWGIPEYGAWAKAKIESIGEKNIILLGHSFGGRIAGYIASENPPWLKGLILYGSPSLYRPAQKVKLKITIAKILKKLGFSRKNEGKMYPIFKRVVAFDQAQYLVKIKTPTLLIWGQDDTEVPISIAKEMNGLISESRLVVIETAGHNAHLDNPDLFYGTVKKFISGLQ